MSRGPVEQWFLALRPLRTQQSDLPLTDMSGFAVLTPPPGRYWADPFLFEHEGRHYLFHEDYRYYQGKGLISVMEIEADGSLSPSVPALSRHYHLSYPDVFEWGGEVYMIPETRQNRSVELYRADSFPISWKLVRTLLPGVQAVDSTLLHHAGKLWLFTNVAVSGGSSHDKLFLYHADLLTGPWVPHPRNPVVDDPGSARPGGRLFWCGGELVRPSQDCSRGYGGGIVFSRVEVLDEKEYRELRIGRVDPGWLPRNRATHTYTRDESWEAVDGMRHVNLGPIRSWTAGGVRVVRRTGRKLVGETRAALPPLARGRRSGS